MKEGNLISSLVIIFTIKENYNMFQKFYEQKDIQIDHGLNVVEYKGNPCSIDNFSYTQSEVKIGVPMD